MFVCNDNNYLIPAIELHTLVLKVNFLVFQNGVIKLKSGILPSDTKLNFIFFQPKLCHDIKKPFVKEIILLIRLYSVFLHIIIDRGINQKKVAFNHSAPNLIQ